MAMSTIKPYLERLNDIIANTNSYTSAIENTLSSSGFGFIKVTSSGFSRSNMLIDLSDNVTKMAIKEETTMPSLGMVKGYNTLNALPLNGHTKNGVKYINPSDPSSLLSATISNTLLTDRADNNVSINRWTSRSIFKFIPDYFGYDRAVYRIPLSVFANGIVISSDIGAPHANTLANYPYPEEIIITSQNTDKNFIHFINVQYSDSHYGHYNGKNYNLMIVKDRTRFGMLNDAGTAFKTFTSIYTNNVDTELAYINGGYLYIPVPDLTYGEELLNTLWDCRVIWRSDAPDRAITTALSLESNRGGFSRATLSSTARVWNCVCYGNGKFVAVANNSKVAAYSTDGVTWHEVTISSTVANWTSVCYGNNRFVAVANGSSLFAYSSDGINWTTATLSSTSRSWTSVCYGNDKFVAVASGSSVFACSTTGLTWTEVTISASAKWSSVCYGNGKFVAVANNSTYVASSTSGSAWTVVSISAPSRSWVSVCYGNGKFVAVASDTNIFAYSGDGIAWYEVIVSTIGWKTVCYANNMFIALTYSGTNYEYSYDGISWNSAPTLQSESSYSSICYGNGRLIAVSNSSSTTTFDYSVDLLPFSQYNDFDIYDGRLALFDKKYGANIATARDSITAFNTRKTGIRSTFGTPFSSYPQINIAPKFDSTYTSSVASEHSWLATGSPNQIFRVNSKYYLGFYYYTASSRGGAKPSSDISNHTSQLYWCLFDNKLNTVTKSSASPTLTIYPCTQYSSAFTNTDKIIRIFANTADYETGISTFYIVTATSIYKATFTVSGSSIVSGFEKLISFPSLYFYFAMRISKDEFWLYLINGGVMHVNISTKYTSTINESSGAVLLGKSGGALVTTTGTLTPISYNDNTLTITSGTQTVNPSSIITINSKYGFIVDTSNVNTLCKLVERYTFSKALTSQSKWEWEECNISNTTRSWNAVCYGGDRFVAINGTNIAYSTNGIEWEDIEFHDSDRNLTSICYGNGKFLITASDEIATSIYLSSDWKGNSYLSAESAENNTGWAYACYGNGKYVAISDNYNTVSYSTDGYSWTGVTLGSTNRKWTSVCYGNGKFIAVASGSNIFAYSSDGATWTEATMTTVSRKWTSVCYGNGKFVAVASGSNIFAYSSDGATWTEATMTTVSRKWTSVCYGNGKFVAVASGSNIFAYSTNGTTWTETTMPIIAREWTSICYGNGKYIITAKNSNVVACGLDI